MDPKNGATKEEPITHVDIPNDAGADNVSDGAGDTGADIETSKPTLAELAEAGLAPGELEMAKKQGLVEGEPDGDKGKDDHSDANKTGATKTDTGKAKGESDGKEKEKTVNERFRVLSNGKSPEQVMADIGEKGELSKDQESVLLASLSQNGQALYWAQKKSRQRAQKAEADLATERADRQKEIDDLKAKLAAKDPEIDPVTGEPVVPEDPKKKPLTAEDLERIETEKADKKKADDAKQTERAREINDALDFQQHEARDRYKDFDNVITLTGEILSAHNTGKLEEMFPDARQRSRIILKARTLLSAYANADRFGEGDFNAADLTYELGKEHPGFGKDPKNNATKTGETGADGNPEKAARVLNNASRRGSSATLTGSGSRRVALDELTPEQAARLPTKEFNKLPAATRERLLRGK